jgi:hypothetical protein
MNARQGGEDRNGLDSEGYLASPAIDPLPTPSRRERLEYIAAMLQELKVMSKEAKFHALASLIEQARREAARQSRMGR